MNWGENEAEKEYASSTDFFAAGGDYFEGDKSFMCVLSIKVPIRKISGILFNDLVITRIFVIISIRKEYMKPYNRV